ncbi:MAG: tryptophan-rich sensory protein [bacterium]|nr:tryptophan-rich sensory protein [Candidatus Kapabacteria bacterium]
MFQLAFLLRPFDLVATLMIIAAVVAIAVFGRIATDARGKWYISLNKPHWQPPNWAFPVAWSIIYILFILSAVIAWHSTGGSVRLRLMVLYALNGSLNVAWSFIFFRSRNTYVAAVDIALLLLSIVWIMVSVVPFSPLAAGLLIPYLFWVAYALALNWTIARMN